MLLPAPYILSAALRPLYRHFSALGLDELLSALPDSRFSRRLVRCLGLPMGIDLSGFDGRRPGWRGTAGGMNGGFIRR